MVKNVEWKKDEYGRVDKVVEGGIKYPSLSKSGIIMVSNSFVKY